jgi:Amt family ammonium transporter
VFAVALAAIIPLGGGAERWRLGASCASTALFAGITYPVFAHWAWGGGWLAQLGQNYGLGRGFVDAGGSSTIHAVGGLTALAIVWILGPRRGKFSPEGIPFAMPGHNGVTVLFGCLLALFGWLGLNCGGAMLFTGAEIGRTALAAVNTVLGATSATLAGAFITRTRFGRPDASLCANSWVGGLVAGSAGCAYMAPAAVIAVGFVAGAVATFGVEFLESWFGIDDPGGAISVHALNGLWGTLAVGILGRFPAGAADGSYQWLAQFTGVATLVGFVFPLTYGLNRLLDRVYPQRVAAEGERQGMDLHELGAGAYPDFATHTPDFL